MAISAASLALMAGLSGCSEETKPTAAVAASDSDVGKAFVSDDGLSLTVTERICGISGVGAEKPEFTAAGQYCTVGVTIDNKTGDDLDLLPLKVSGSANDTEYFPDYWAGTAADGGTQVVIADGKVLKSTLFFDMPKGLLLQEISFESPWDGLTKVTVAF